MPAKYDDSIKEGSKVTVFDTLGNEYSGHVEDWDPNKRQLSLKSGNSWTMKLKQTLYIV